LGYGTINALRNVDFLDSSNDWQSNGYTASVTNGILSFTSINASPIAYAAYIVGSVALYIFDPLLTYTATARVRWASGTTGGNIGFGSGWTPATTLSVSLDDTSWKTITTNLIPGTQAFGVYGTTTTATWEMDYFIISRAGNVLDGLEFSAQPFQAHANNGAFWTFSNSEPSCHSARFATLKTPSVITADGAMGITVPANWRPLAFTIRNSGTTNASNVYVRIGSTSGGGIASASPNAHAALAPALNSGALVSSFSSVSYYATGLVTGNRIWEDVFICR